MKEGFLLHVQKKDPLLRQLEQIFQEPLRVCLIISQQVIFPEVFFQDLKLLLNEYQVLLRLLKE